MGPSWHVGAILREDLQDTLRFAAWYLDAGADRLTLYFDDPQDLAIGVLRHNPRIQCIACTSEFWRDLGLDPDTRFTKRQNAALTHAYRQSDTDWFLNVDADEFLHVDGRAIRDFLDDIPEDAVSVRIETAEGVGTTHDHPRRVFRLPMERDAARRVYGEDAGLFGPRRKGLVGHAAGKSAIRGGQGDLSLRQHWPVRGKEIPPEHVAGRESGAYLLHMIGLDYGPWRAKVDWRVASRGFIASLTQRVAEALEREDPEPELRDLHQRLHRMDAAALERLAAENALLELSLDLDAGVQRHFSG
ncbi:glycosyltransferase family 2 protein [Lutimaribacter marinistellae]